MAIKFDLGAPMEEALRAYCAEHRVSLSQYCRDVITKDINRQQEKRERAKEREAQKAKMTNGTSHAKAKPAPSPALSKTARSSIREGRA